MIASSPVTATMTGPGSNLRTMSPSIFGTTATPVSSTSAGTWTRFVISRSEPTSSRPSPDAVMRRSWSTGSAPVRLATVRCAVATASARVSRSQRNFTSASSGMVLRFLLNSKFSVVLVVGAVDCGRLDIRAAHRPFSSPLRCPQVPQSVVARHPMAAGCPRLRVRFPHSSTALSTGPVLDAADELVDLFEHHAPLGHLAPDLLARVHHRGVVAAPELLGDLRIAVVGELAEDVHPDLARGHERPAPALATQVFDRPPEHLRGLFEDHLRCDHARPARGQQVGEHLVRDVFGQRNAMEARIR